MRYLGASKVGLFPADQKKKKFNSGVSFRTSNALRIFTVWCLMGLKITLPPKVCAEEVSGQGSQLYNGNPIGEEAVSVTTKGFPPPPLLSLCDAFYSSKHITFFLPTV